VVAGDAESQVMIARVRQVSVRRTGPKGLTPEGVSYINQAKAKTKTKAEAKTKAEGKGGGAFGIGLRGRMA